MVLGQYPPYNGQPGREPLQRNDMDHPRTPGRRDRRRDDRDRPRTPRDRGIRGHEVPSPEALEAMNKCRVMPELTDYIRNTAFPISNVTQYEKIAKIGQGTFGEVFKAKCRRTDQIVALKKILIENESEGFPITALREVKMLQLLKHDNITELIEVCSNKSASNPRERSTFYLVFAFCDHDLAGLLNNRRIKFTLAHIKTLLKHMFQGLDKLHRQKVMHRDMKAANVLVSKEGVLKLADFGLSRCHLVRPEHKKNSYTNQVVTLWYRPPELLFGERNYDYSIDLWGAGCIMAEMWTRNPILKGDSEQKQLQLISHLCGSISTRVWPEVSTLSLWNTMELPTGLQPLLTARFSNYIRDSAGMDLLETLLTLNPRTRSTAKEAMDHRFFFAHPHPQDNIKDLMDTIKTSMFELNIGNVSQAQQRPGGAQQGRSKAVPPGQYHDMVF